VWLACSASLDGCGSTHSHRKKEESQLVVNPISFYQEELNIHRRKLRDVGGTWGVFLSILFCHSLHYALFYLVTSFKPRLLLINNWWKSDGVIVVFGGSFLLP
jgi:hypothetical protein